MGTLVNAQNIRGVYYTGAKDVVAVDDVSDPDRGGRGAWAGRRVRQRKDHARLDHLPDRSAAAACGARHAGDRRPGPRARWPRQDSAYLARGRGFHAAAGRNELRQSDQADTSPCLRRDAVARQQDLQRRGARPRARTHHDIGSTRSGPGRVSPPAVRRHEAAHRHDHQYPAQSAAAGRR